jgi:hypothetical protein
MSETTLTPHRPVEFTSPPREVHLIVKGRPGLPAECINLLRRHAVKVHFLGIQRCDTNSDRAIIRIIGESIDADDLTNACDALEPIGTPTFLSATGPIHEPCST